MYEANPAPAKSQINIAFDIVSPFSFFAFTVAQHYAHVWRAQGYAVQYIPVYQAGIMAGSGNQPPMSVPAKARNSTRDMHRWAALLGLKHMTTPERFPANSIHCARLCTVIKRYHAAKLTLAMDALWRGYWIDHIDIASLQHCQTILSSVFTGAELDVMMKLSRGAHFKDVLRTNTEAAVKQGCFGVPWIEVVKESGEAEYFFGNDRWHQVTQYAGLQWDGYSVVGGGERSCI